jgi:hypothetical protein
MSPGPGIVDPVDPDHPYPLMVDKSADAILEYKSLPRVYGAPCGVPH